MNIINNDNNDNNNNLRAGSARTKSASPKVEAFAFEAPGAETGQMGTACPTGPKAHPQVISGASSSPNKWLSQVQRLPLNGCLSVRPPGKERTSWVLLFVHAVSPWCSPVILHYNIL